MNGVFLKYIDVPPDIKEALDSYTATHLNPSLSWISLAELKTAQPAATSYATFEHNYWKLDGTYQGITGESTLMWNDEVSVSNESGYVFTNPPVLTRIWDGYQTTPGVSIEFYPPDYCNDLTIQWYQDSTLLDTKTFHPDALTYFCENRVELFNKMVITFNGMTKENRFLKVVDVLDGTTYTFDNRTLRKVSVLEEIDPISDTLPINTLSVEFSHKIDYLNLVFQNKQIIKAYLNDILCGNFFISKSEGTYRVTAQDYIGLLDTAQFPGGYYKNKLAGELIDEIMDGEDNISFSVSEEIAGIALTGIIKKGSKRNALMQVLFATMGVADDSRSNTLMITAANDTPTQVEIPKAKTFFDGSENAYSSPVTEVRLTCHNYVLSAEAETVFSSELTAGTYTIEFNDPIDTRTVTISGATSTTLSSMYAIISVASAGTVTISAKVYKDNPVIKSAYNTLVVAGTPTNTVSYSDKTLISASNADAVLAALLAYHKHINTYAAKVVSEIKPGDATTLWDRKNTQRSGKVIRYEYTMRRKRIGTVTEIVD